MEVFDGAEFHLPPFGNILNSNFQIPFISYFLFFQIIGYGIRRYTWTSYKGFKQYRLRNLTLCVVHSCISGIWSFVFTVTHPRVMFQETIHWYSSWAAQLPILSMAYFVCDTMDMLRHELSKWTLELLLHHTATIFVFASAVLPQKFIPYAYWALLMEVNSIFLHLRSLMQISGYKVLKSNLFRMIQYANILTFIIFRFSVQIWQIHWAWTNQHRFHTFYMSIAFVGGGFFFIVNVILFLRVLASDGYLGEFGRRHTAINRYANFFYH